MSMHTSYRTSMRWDLIAQYLYKDKTIAFKTDSEQMRWSNTIIHINSIFWTYLLFIVTLVFRVIKEYCPHAYSWATVYAYKYVYMKLYNLNFPLMLLWKMHFLIYNLRMHYKCHHSLERSFDIIFHKGTKPSIINNVMHNIVIAIIKT